MRHATRSRPGPAAFNTGPAPPALGLAGSISSRAAAVSSPARSPSGPAAATPGGAFPRHAGLPALAIVSLLLACAPGGGGHGADGFRGEPLPRPVERPDFTLTDTEGRPYSFLEQTRGRVTLLFFGYTWCPDICPIHMANIGQAMKTVPAEDRHRVKVVFVSTDPARDDPARIREWLDAFDPSFVGLRGAIEEVNRVQNQVGLPASVLDEPGEDGGYLVGHAASVLAFSADGPARLRYPFGTRQSAWAHDLPMLIGESDPGS